MSSLFGFVIVIMVQIGGVPTEATTQYRFETKEQCSASLVEVYTHFKRIGIKVLDVRPCQPFKPSI